MVTKTIGDSAHKNSLEHSLQNVMDYKEKISVAASRIKDVGIAKGVMEQKNLRY